MPYYDHAATSYPKDPRVIQAIVDSLRDVGVSPDRGGYPQARAAGRLFEQARARAAALLSVSSPERITFTLNATDALNIALKGLLRSGDEVVTTQTEHNSVMRPLRGLELRERISLRVASADSQGRVHAADVLALVGAHTRLVVMSHASNVTGFVQPVAQVGAELARRGSSARLLVDAAQTAGYRDLKDVASVAHAIACSGHKGPGGPLGTGILWTRPGLEVAPLREGGTGTRSEWPYQPMQDPGALEAGSANLPGIAGLNEALRIRLDEQGLTAVHEARRTSTAKFLERARSISGLIVYGPDELEEREPVFPCRVHAYSVEEASVLLEQQCSIQQRAGLHCAPGMHRALGTDDSGTLRFSFGANPMEEDVAFSLESLRMLCA